jgi:phosphatidylserine/phosphatidylglycerophosphate/cardiolipin synthase-like enzyme
MAPGAPDLSDRELDALLRALARGGLIAGPLAAATLSGIGLGHLGPRLGPLAGLPSETARTLVEAIVAERSRLAGPVVDLVWTGPEATSGSARDTATVVRELFTHAQRSVLIAGYSFDHGNELFAPLHRAMAARSLDVRLFVQIPCSPSEKGTSSHVAGWLNRFLLENWRQTTAPTIYYDPRTVTPGSFASLHAKCIVVDEARSLVTSANFTDRGQTRNVEVGALIDDPGFGSALVRQWDLAVAAGIFVRA